ncbi:glycosyltransferase family 2 protein [Flavobacterium gilvum]|uniref:Glycosyl transferase family 2 n=1 Tax=Flavobacterium gilvum TaxID=1492737 RepID=A0AAC9I5X0_9FLAO|nr:glycosyltransferase [Flavobacterium gilvum]AOW11041.1 glycosyl transferase family 2 [Flavobacterium gilvum]KFC57986.1 glycosyltransferase family 2 [Flavobacterium gilvum]
MQNNPFISICIPANGRIEYVRNTLTSIYTEENDLKLPLNEFEVILSDNDPNCGLEILKTEFPYKNFHYFNTNCEGFLNSFHVLTYARGNFLKLHNSQETFRSGALLKIIGFLKSIEKSKPAVFFTSGFLTTGEITHFSKFDDFMCNLSYWSSWSNGFGIWRDDFDNIKENNNLNKLFPHTSLFLTQYNKATFILNDELLFNTQFVKKRGGHNKFHAFSIEYPSLIDSIYNKGYIKLETKNRILKDILYNYLSLLFFNVKIAKRETFSADGFKQNIQVYFPKGSYWLVLCLSFIIPLKVIWRKIKINYLLKSKI